MKKLLAIILSLSVLVLFAGCAVQPNDYSSVLDSIEDVETGIEYESVVVGSDNNTTQNNTTNSNTTTNNNTVTNKNNTTTTNKNNYTGNTSSTNKGQNNSTSNNNVAHEHAYANGKCSCGLKEVILYSDSLIQMTFKSAQKGRSSDRIELYFYVKNKSSKQLLIQVDAVSLNGYTFNSLIMSDPVGPNSIGTVNVTVQRFDSSLIDINNIKSIGGQFRIIDDSGNDDTYNAVFTNVKLDGTGKGGSFAGYPKKMLVYNDSNCSIYYKGAAQGRSSDRIEVYFYVENRTSTTLLLQANSITLNGYSFSDLIMSDPILSNTVGEIDLTVDEFNPGLVNINSITSIGGQFRIIDDLDGWDTYKADLSSSNPNASGTGSNTGSNSGSVSSTPTPSTPSGDNTKWTYSDAKTLDGYIEKAVAALKNAQTNFSKGSAFKALAASYVNTADGYIESAIALIESKSDITLSDGSTLLGKCKDAHTYLSQLDGITINMDNVEQHSETIRQMCYQGAVNVASIRILTSKLLLEF